MHLEIAMADHWYEAPGHDAPISTQKSPGSGGYVDCSDFLDEWDVSSGQRDDPRQEYGAGDGTISVLNFDDRWEADNPRSPYFPHLRDLGNYDKKIRLVSKRGSAVEPLWTGYIESIEPDWAIPGRAIITVADGLALFAGSHYPRDSDERDKKLLGKWNGITDEWTQVEEFDPGFEALNVWATLESEPYHGELHFDLLMQLKYTNHLGVGGRHARLPLRGSPSEKHKLKVNLAGHDLVRSIGNCKAKAGTGAQFKKAILRVWGEPALIPRALSSAQIGVIADALGWPDTERALVAGLETLSPMSPWGADYLSQLQEIATSELGAVKILADGRLASENRASRYYAWRDGGAKAVFDPNGARGIACSDTQPKLGNDRVVDEVLVTRTPLYEDDAPTAQRVARANSTRTLEMESRVLTDSRALQQARWLFAAFSVAREQVGSISVNPLASQDEGAAWDAVTTLKLSDPVSCYNAPTPGAGVLSLLDFNIEGIQHAGGGGGAAWTTRYVLSSRIPVAPYA